MSVCTKRRYSKKEAQGMVNLRTKGRSRYRHNKPKFLRIYQCPICNFYHLSHLP